MNWKELFKPTLLKISLGLGALMLSYFYKYVPDFTDASKVFTGFPNFTYIQNHGTYHGFPFIFYGEGQLLFLGLIVDLLLWYLIACIVLKVASKKKTK